AEGRDGIRLERAVVGVVEVEGGRQPDRVHLFDDGDGRPAAEVGGDTVGDIDVEQVIEGRSRVVEVGRVGDRAAAVGRLAVEGGGLVGILPVGQVTDLLDDHGQALRDADVGELVEV